jgi:hypothetical protein
MDQNNKPSPAIEILSAIWKHTPYKSHEHVNTAMQQALSFVIETDIRFDLEDFNFIKKNFRPGYWMGLSENGHHYGEHYYKKACINNPSCVASFEHCYNRQFFILDGKRVYIWLKFMYDGMACHITGWSEDNTTLMAVGYSRRI